MPELPEVEATRRALAARLAGVPLAGMEVRERRLRWDVPVEVLSGAVPESTLVRVERRAKYLLLRLSTGTILVHLGMSGSLRVVDERQVPGPHEHVDWIFSSGARLRLRDPRRFGAVLWAGEHPEQHRLLRHLGPEPLEPSFSGAYLHGRLRGRRAAIKSLLMDARIVVGVGNIYAAEALHQAGVHPGRAGGRVGRHRAERLVDAVRTVLARAIESGGTTFRDYRGVGGERGAYADALAVYGRQGAPCLRCRGTLRLARIGARSTVYCPRCQR